jgi:hypothetical protein
MRDEIISVANQNQASHFVLQFHRKPALLPILNSLPDQSVKVKGATGPRGFMSHLQVTFIGRFLLGAGSYLSLEQPVLLSPSARFRNWRWRRPFRRRGRRRYVLFDQVPNHCRKHQGDQFRAPVFQRQSGPQNGNQHRAPVLRGLSLHNCCAAKFPRCIDETSPG